MNPLGAVSPADPELDNDALDRDLTARDQANEIGADPNLWRDPDLSILDGGRRPAPTFPLRRLGAWQDWVIQTAEGAGSPVDYVAAALLATAAGLIGNARWVSPWPAWREPCALWFALCGQPSCGKSPALHAVMAPLRELEAELAERHETRIKDFERDKVVALTRRMQWQDDVKAAMKDGKQPPDIPPDAHEAEPPPRPRLYAVDATTERLAIMLSENPKGLLYYRDELSGLVLNLQRYGGSDRPFFLETYGGRNYTVDRVKHAKPIIIQHLTMSLIGNVTPDRLQPLLVSGEDDGFGARLLPIWPEPAKPKRPTKIADPQFAMRAFRRLMALELGLNEEGRAVPVLMPLTEEAVNILQAWREEADLLNRDYFGPLLSWRGKAPGVLVRIALTLELLNWSAGPNETPPPNKVGVPAVAAAADIVSGYLTDMATRSYGDAALPEQERNAAVLARTIQQKGEVLINASTVRRHWRLPGLRDKQSVSAALDVLTEAGWVARRPTRAGDTPGRMRSDYIVNATVLGPQRNGATA